jgi:hypothetical protein
VVGVGWKNLSNRKRDAFSEKSAQILPSEAGNRHSETQNHYSEHQDFLPDVQEKCLRAACGRCTPDGATAPKQ